MYQVDPQEILNLLERRTQQMSIVPLSQKEEAGFRVSIERFLKRYMNTEEQARDAAKPHKLENPQLLEEAC